MDEDNVWLTEFKGLNPILKWHELQHNNCTFSERIVLPLDDRQTRRAPVNLLRGCDPFSRTRQIVAPQLYFRLCDYCSWFTVIVVVGGGDLMRIRGPNLLPQIEIKMPRDTAEEQPLVFIHLNRDSMTTIRSLSHPSSSAVCWSRVDNVLLLTHPSAHRYSE